MDALGANSPMIDAGIYAMKKAADVQEQMVSKALESLPLPEASASAPVSGLASEGIGSNLDLRA